MHTVLLNASHSRIERGKLRGIFVNHIRHDALIVQVALGRHTLHLLAYWWFVDLGERVRLYFRRTQFMAAFGSVRGDHENQFRAILARISHLDKLPLQRVAMMPSHTASLFWYSLLVTGSVVCSGCCYE
jgi:hypothetical protein